MLKQITLLSTMLVFAGLNGQTIPNGSFENWDNTSFDNPNAWATTNSFIYAESSIVGVTKETGNTGYGIKLLTVASPDYDDASGITNSNYSTIDGAGGEPYSQQPTALEGYYKCDLQAGDSALIIVLFKKQGTVISTDYFRIGGQQNTFTKFSFPLSLASQPDSVIFFAISSDVDAGTETAGSYIILDDILFTGTGITQQMANNDFENWTTVPYLTPTNWGREADGVTMTTDAHTGDYAAEITTVVNLGDVSVGGIFMGDKKTFLYTGGGIPYKYDTLVFYYKYIPAVTDSAMVVFEYYTNGFPSYSFDAYLKPANNYTRAEIPLITNGTPDTVRWEFLSSSRNYNFSTVGSKLIIDNVFLKSEEVPTGVAKVVSSKVSIYPNPVADNITFSLTNDFEPKQLVITDAVGRVVVEQYLYNNQTVINTQLFATGMYFYKAIAANGDIATGKFLKQ
jgi:hypothetical protein